MIVSRKLGFAILVLVCLRAATAQPQERQIAAIASALRANEFDRALELSRAALQESPGNAQLWAMQGVAYAKQGHNQEALASFQRALKLSPDYLPALQGAAQIEFDAGNSAAIPHLQRVLRLRPADQTAHGMLAVLRYRQGNCDAAVVHFEKAGNLFDSQVDALHAYATCLVKLRKPDRAAKVFQRTLAS